MNNKGFAIMSMVYGLIVVAGLILFGTLSIMSISLGDAVTNNDNTEEKLIYCFATYNKDTKLCEFGNNNSYEENSSSSSSSNSSTSGNSSSSSDRYIKIGYIGSNGNTTFNTNIKDTEGWHVEMKYEFLDIPNNGKWLSIMGTTHRFDDGKYARSYLNINPSNPRRVQFDIGDCVNIIDFTVQTNRVYTIEANTFNPKQSLKITHQETTRIGIIERTETKTDINKTYSCYNIPHPGQDLHLFANYKANLYYAKFYDKEGKLIRDYTPMKRTDTNKIGLYDAVNEEFNPIN